MVRKAALSLETLVPLGADKLARLVLDEANRNKAFRKLVTAALAAQKGPEAVAKIVDRRLGALEKAKSFIDWDRIRNFRDDLSATVAVMTGELADSSPALAVDRLLRFIATHEGVFERIDDSSGHIQGIYEEAIEALNTIAPKLKADDQALLPQKVMTALGASTHGYLVEVADAVAPHLPHPLLKDWGTRLLADQTAMEAQDAGRSDGNSYHSSNASQYRQIRQIIADCVGDLDGYIALEQQKHPNLQDNFAMAKRLLNAGRAAEALDWIRREPHSRTRFPKPQNLIDDLSPRKVSLEGQILDAMGQKAEAQDLRWSSFEATLNVSILKEHLAALADFEEFDVLDRAFAYALQTKDIYSALSFFMEWPKHDMASKLVIDNQAKWNGNHYYQLATIAKDLEHEYPLAATILYRALLDDILASARSKAYPYAAHYLSVLESLAPQLDDTILRIAPHATYFLDIQKQHARKSGFWAVVARR